MVYNFDDEGELIAQYEKESNGIISGVQYVKKTDSNFDSSNTFTYWL